MGAGRWSEAEKIESAEELKQRLQDEFFALFADFGGVEHLDFASFYEEEEREILARCDALAALIGIQVTRQRWLNFMNASRHMVSLKHLKCRRSFMGAAINTGIALCWDDVDGVVLPKLPVVLKYVRQICREYYPKESDEHVFAHMKQWMDHDTFTRKDPELRRRLTLKSLQTYWQFRVLDSAVPCWFGVIAPVYKNPDFTMMSFYLAQLALKPIMVVSDVYSYPKEVRNRESCNFLYHLEEMDAVEKDAMVRIHMDEMRGNLETLQEFDEVLQEITLHTVFGHLVWASSCSRYVSSITSESSLLVPSDERQP